MLPELLHPDLLAPGVCSAAGSGMFDDAPYAATRCVAHRSYVAKHTARTAGHHHSAPPHAGWTQAGQRPGAVPQVTDATMAEAKLVGDGAAGGQVILSAAARAALLATTGQGSKARAAAAAAGYCLIHMGRHVLVRV
jgi:hypothetical protein